MKKQLREAIRTARDRHVRVTVVGHGVPHMDKNLNGGVAIPFAYRLRPGIFTALNDYEGIPS